MPFLLSGKFYFFKPFSLVGREDCWGNREVKCKKEKEESSQNEEDEELEKRMVQGRELKILNTCARHKYQLSLHETNWLVEEKANKKSCK